MTDTHFWILLIAVIAAIGTALWAASTAAEALRVARSGGGSAGRGLVAPSRADRKGAEILVQRAEALLAKVSSLPPVMLGPGADTKVREGALWVEAEVASLRDTTPALAALIAEALDAAAPAMAWLLERTIAIRATSKGSGEYLIDFPHDAWRRNHQAAMAALQELVARGRAAKEG